MCLLIHSDDCQGFRKCLDSLVRGITADRAALGATIQTINLTVPESAVDYEDEKQSGETLNVLLPHLPNLRKLTAFYVGVDEWPVSKLMLLPNPAKLTSLTLNIVHDYPSFLAFLRACPFLEYLAIDMVQVKNGETPDVIPPDMIPCLRGVYCDSDFLYLCVLAGRRIEHINVVGCDISWTIRNGADLDAIAGPMALARSLSVLGQMYLQCTLREDVISPYSHLEFLAVAICDKITIGDVHMMGERWSKKLRYIYLQCGGCIPDHDAVAEVLFAAMASLAILDIEIKRKSGSKSVFPRCSRYFRGSPMEKDTAINFVFPSCDDFQDPMWVDSVEDLVEHRLKGIAGEPPLKVS
ncbi:hypothetical protein BDN71DRAFT_1513152 [Pleurotus eryngii]|uniref:FBD domain-containing protein n=1 Tax=Pleurotus eryngii TaxID=5323 RepID=A0A9P5ZJN0_PLEER|nr:hypothetical protein BDN71DRAFT_1513152 [Pleurotus eryngii]